MTMTDTQAPYAEHSDEEIASAVASLFPAYTPPAPVDPLAAFTAYAWGEVTSIFVTPLAEIAATAVKAREEEGSQEHIAWKDAQALADRLAAYTAARTDDTLLPEFHATIEALRAHPRPASASVDRDTAVAYVKGLEGVAGMPTTTSEEADAIRAAIAAWQTVSKDKPRAKGTRGKGTSPGTTTMPKVVVHADGEKMTSTTVDAGPDWASTVSNACTSYAEGHGGARPGEESKQHLRDALTRCAGDGGTVTVGEWTVSRAV